ncbi:hypothetical protein CL656_04680, partial [bacterium]|nr:hypothetical protein [bacterium]
MITCLFLILCHNFDNAQELKNIWLSNTFINNKNNDNFLFSFYFIEYKDDLIEKYYIDEDNHTIYIKGIESVIPGCFYKTIESIKIVKDKYNPDFIIRTNISTIFNFNNLFLILSKLNERDKNKTPYFLGGPLLNLETINDIKIFIQNLFELNIINKDKI